jgi:hypothetical protein
MKKFNLLLLAITSFIVGPLTMASATAATQYEVVGYTWCNGPYSGKDGTGCPTYASWEGVDLKRVSKVSVASSNTSQAIEITDSNGVSWRGTSEECNSKPSDIRGCKLSADFGNINKISINVSSWDYNKPTQRISFTIENQNSISIFPPDNSYLVLEVKAVK